MLGFLKNVQGLIASVIANHGIQIYANAKDEAEYRKMRRLLGADNNKNTLDCQDINDALLANGITSLAGKEELLLLHDVSDIRKEHSVMMENLGKVRDLKNNVINGFTSFNSVAVDTQGKSLTLLGVQIYSNKDVKYVTEEEYKQYLQFKQENKELFNQTESILDLDSGEMIEVNPRKLEVAQLIEENSHINHGTVFRNQLLNLSNRFKSSGTKKITHVLDREHDNNDKFEYINNELNDDFVIRLKTTRTSENTTTINTDKDCMVFMISRSEFELLEIHADLNYTIITNNKCYDNVISRNQKIAKIFYCIDDIKDLLKTKNYKTNMKLSKSLSAILPQLTDNPLGQIKTWYATNATSIVKVKLVAEQFPNIDSYYHSKLNIKNKCYQNVKVTVSYGIYFNGYQVIKIELFDKDGNHVFKQPMLLITNKTITSPALALQIYNIYRMRSKIESVFKFLKDVLGWESFNIQSFTAIKNLLTLCFFIAGYFYEIESVLIRNHMIEHIAYLGGGKEEITRYYVLKGFQVLAHKILADDYIEEKQITQDELKEMYRAAFLMV
jgi:hypothetical protein